MLRRVLVPVLVLASLLTPAVALADYQELLKDACRDERVNGTYSQKDFRDALANIPADADQYTSCRQVLQTAQLAAARAQAAGQGAGAPSTADADTIAALSAPDPLANATPAQKQAVAQAAKAGSAPVTIAGKVLEPSTLGAGRPVAAGLSDLPAPLLGALALIALLGAGAAVAVLLPRVRDRRQP